MIYRGEPPYLECSTRGDKRFSPFYAIVNGKSIENQYQAAKILEDGTTGHDWRSAKGKKAVNIEYCRELYIKLWRQYLDEHPELYKVLADQTGLSDMFGQKGNTCQAIVLWDLRNEYLKNSFFEM